MENITPGHENFFLTDNFFNYAENRNFGDVHIVTDHKVGLRAIVAIHSTKLGPALGGCRCIRYETANDALFDALRLSRAMSYKAAVVGLPFGGGKAVLLKPPHIENREKYFARFGQFLEGLNGRYITAVDSGTSLEDMEYIHQNSNYIASLPSHGEPSGFTALGVLRGIQAAVKFKLKRDAVKGIHVAIQGVGKVGYGLAKELHQRGAKLTVADVNPENTKRCEEDFGAKVVSVDEIYSVECDVFSPCALGAVINPNTENKINAPIIAGAANNQLLNMAEGERIHGLGHLYAPDFVINAGGLIYAAHRYLGKNDDEIIPKIDNIYTALMDIFKQSEEKAMPTSDIANAIAEAKLYG